LTACFAIAWNIHRAHVQSISLDEQTTFHYWVDKNGPAHWEPHSNNHVLNSMLMRLFIWMFGLSHLSVRAGALLGGCLYIFAAYAFCTLLSRGAVLNWALFVCLVYNPFLMDYLVVARGYGLALGFLMLAIYLFARTLVRRKEPGRREILLHAMAVSVCIGFSLTANFSFGYADGFLLLAALVVWTLQQPGLGIRARVRLACVCFIPALVILFVLAGSVLAAFPKSQLFWGTQSFSETWHEIYGHSFAELNPYLVNPVLADLLRTFPRHVPRAACRLILLYVFLLLLTRRLRYRHARSRLLLAGSLAAVFFLTLAAHWLQFKILKIPLPLERTSLFLVPLATAVVGAVLSVTPSNLLDRVTRGSGIAVMLIASIYFAGTLHDTYFAEWRNCADLRSAFPVIVDLSRRAGVREFPSDLNYTGTLNFYRILYKVADLNELQNFDTMPPGKAIYVIPRGAYADFIRTEGLKIAYHGTVSDLAVVYRPSAVGEVD
jgi:hypothetical protein